MCYKLSTGVTDENIDGKNILVTENGDVAVLSEIAGLVLNCLLVSSDIETVVQKVTSTYNIDDVTARADIENLLSGLIDKGLISICKGT
jgi:hypothetical protein